MMNTTRSQTANNEVFSTPRILNAAELNELRGVPLRLQKPSKRKNLYSEEDENLDLSSFASKKAASAGGKCLQRNVTSNNAGALGTGLLSSNADQLKTVLLKEEMNYFDFTKIVLLGVSIFLQVLSFN